MTAQIYWKSKGRGGGLEIEEIYDNLGLGHSIVKCKLK